METCKNIQFSNTTTLIESKLYMDSSYDIYICMTVSILNLIVIPVQFEHTPNGSVIPE
jgi:hypothetical protein